VQASHERPPDGRRRVLPPEPNETAQQIWSAVHGAVILELQGLVLTPDPEATYEATLDTVLRGLAPGTS
jgi:hypothetical protein